MKTKICVIDDEQQLVEEISTWLDFEGYEVYAANDGESGLKTILEHRPDLVICDINMPMMDGYEVLTEVRSMPDVQNTPFLFLTAQATVDDFRRGMALGADDYLIKPFNYEDLLSAIVGRLDKQHSLSLSAFQDFSRLMISNVDEIKQDFVKYLDRQIVSPLNALRIYLNAMAGRTIESQDLNEALARLNDVTKNVEQVQAMLTPDALIYLGMVPMVNWLTFYYRSEQKNLQFTFDHINLNDHYPEHILRHLFAILDEALGNVIKHAKASSVNIYLQQIDQRLYGSVSDDGIGFDAEMSWQHINSLGLVIMRERARMCGGDLEVISDREVGTIINFDIDVEVPIQETSSRSGIYLPQISQSSPTPSNEPLSTVVIAHSDRLRQLGLKQLIAANANMSIIATCANVEAITNLIEDDLQIDITLISVDLLEAMTVQQRAVASVSCGRLIAIGNTQQELAENDLKYVRGYLLESQVVDSLLVCIEKVLTGKTYILSTVKTPDSEKEDPLDILSQREKEILNYLVQNYRNADIADELVISIRTVETHRANIMRKLGIKDKSELILFAVRKGIIQLDE